MTEFAIKDSGARQEFAGGMVRDTEDSKIDYTSALHGPMFERWMAHCTKGREKYPDTADGVPNWTLGAGDESVLRRARRSAFRHFMAYMRGETDEDHAAGVMFNLNLAEFIKDSLAANAFAVATDADPEVFTPELLNDFVSACDPTAGFPRVRSRDTITPETQADGALRAQATRERLARSRTIIQSTPDTV